MSLRGALLKFALLATILIVAFLVFRYTPLNEFLTRERMVSVMEDLRSAWWAPLALIGLYVVLSPTGLPVSPLIWAGGIVFGIWWGWLYNFIGALLGASASFLLARVLGRDLVTHMVPDALLERVESLLERHGFWSLLLAWVPIGGDALTLIAGIMKVRLWLFVLLVGTGKGLRYLSVVYLAAWSHN